MTVTNGFTPTSQAVASDAVNVAGGNATVYSVGTAILDAGANLGVDGTLQSRSGLQLASTAELISSGTVVGATENFGTIAPGNSPGTLSFSGGLDLRNPSALVFQIGGLAPGSGYDAITVAGSLTLIGGLQLSFYGRIPECDHAGG